MHFLRKISLQLWLRICTSLLFFFGGAFIIFWAQGFRFDFSDRTIVSTGVISVSSVPEKTNVFLNSRSVGVAPDTFFGVPLGENAVCLQKDGYLPFCDMVSVDSQDVQQLKNVFLLPYNLVPLEWGEASDFLWDTQGRGFLQLFPDLSSALIYEKGEVRFYDPLLSEEAFLTQQGNILFPLVSAEEKVFFSEPKGKDFYQFLPDWSGFLFHEGNTLSLRKPSENRSRQLAHFFESIEFAFFLPESESILVSTATNIVFITRPGVPVVKLFQKDSETPLRFFADSKTIFWQYKGKIFSFSF